MISVTTAAELTSVEPGADHPTPGDIDHLRHLLVDELHDRVAGWNRPGGMLGITKSRLRAATGCPASILGETAKREISDAMALGSIVDVAASMLLVSDTVPGRAPWLGAILAVMTATEPEITAHIGAMAIDARDEFRSLVHDRCERLRELLGDLRGCEGTAQERFRVVLTGPGVTLTGRTDLVLGRRNAAIVEVKSGTARGEQIDELAFYALLASLRDGRAPVAVAVVALGSSRIDAHAVTYDLVEAAARRVIDAATALVEVDRAVADGTWPRTLPGPFCSWCAVAPRCPDVPDIALAERELRATSPRPHDVAPLDHLDDEPVDLDAETDEPW